MKGMVVAGVGVGAVLIALVVWSEYNAQPDPQPENAKKKNAEAPPAEDVPVTVPQKVHVQIIEIEAGSGREAKKGDVLEVHYTGWLRDGTKFDSSKDRDEPFVFELGAGKVIKGWDQGMVGMKVGGTRKLIIPPELGYGGRGSGKVIPPHAELTFQIELLKIH